MGKLRIRDRTLKDHIVKFLTEGVDGMYAFQLSLRLMVKLTIFRFRWVACQMDHLRECSTDRDRRDALTKPPPDLPRSYERILERFNRSSKENQSLVRHTLLWVVQAL